MKYIFLHSCNMQYTVRITLQENKEKTQKQPKTHTKETIKNTHINL